MKKIFAIFMFALLCMSFLSIPLKEVKAEGVISAQFVPKSYKLLWNDFKSMLDGNFENKYNPVLTWSPMETEKGLATSYSVKIEKLYPDNTWKAIASKSSVIETTYTTDYVVYEGEDLRVTITPKVGTYVGEAVQDSYTIPSVTEQVSPVSFNQYVDEYQTVGALINAIQIKNSNPDTDIQDTIYENIMKIYLNDFQYDSLEFVNEATATRELLKRAEEIVTPIALDSTLTREVKQEEIIQAQKTFIMKSKKVSLLTFLQKR